MIHLGWNISFKLLICLYIQGEVEVSWKRLKKRDWDIGMTGAFFFVDDLRSKRIIFDGDYSFILEKNDWFRWQTGLTRILLYILFLTW